MFKNERISCNEMLISKSMVFDPRLKLFPWGPGFLRFYEINASVSLCPKEVVCLNCLDSPISRKILWKLRPDKTRFFLKAAGVCLSKDSCSVCSNISMINVLKVSNLKYTRLEDLRQTSRHWSHQTSSWENVVSFVTRSLHCLKMVLAAMMLGC